MTDEVRRDLVRMVNEMKSYLAGQDDFYQEPTMRSAYVAMLTLEGAFMFDDIVEFGDLCLTYCKRKERDFTNN